MSKPRFSGGVNDVRLERAVARTVMPKDEGPQLDDDEAQIAVSGRIGRMTGFTCLGEDRSAKEELVNRRAAAQRRKNLRRRLAQKAAVKRKIRTKRGA